MQEIWLPIIGYEGYYEISNHGNVRSLNRIDCRGHKLKGKILSKPHSSYSSQHYIRVGLCVGKKQKTYTVHKLVAKAFIPNPNNYTEINHIDGNKSNNIFTNLEWCSHSHNIQHSYNNGLAPIGSKHHKAKLTEKDVVDIKLRLTNSETQINIAKHYGVSHVLIHKIKTGKSWAHVPVP